jgi:circadian clock protein KaiC
MVHADDRPALLSTGVPGLDLILGGGFPRGSLVSIVGAPGTGKTILSMQIAFAAVRNGQPVLFLTALSEPHDKLLRHLRPLAFFDPDLIAAGIELLNLQSLLAATAGESIDAIVAAARKNGTILIVIDGFAAIDGFLASTSGIVEFLHELGAKLGLLGVTVLLTSHASPRDSARYSEFTVADGLIGLGHERERGLPGRSLEVLKLRGMAHLAGLHSFKVTERGIVCYPRLEALPIEQPQHGTGRAGFGLAALDEMLGGGLNEGTTTMLVGSPRDR